MGLKPYLGPTLAVLFACTAYSSIAQVVPAATEKNVPWAVGVGLSGYNPDWEQGHLLGGTLWIDYTLPRMPAFLRGLGIDAEARDLNYGRSSQSPNLREDTAMGGLIYSWPRYRNFRPYGKFLAGYGNRDAQSPTLLRYHDSRNIEAAGAGVDYRVTRSIWVRADYEYQFWPDMRFRIVDNTPTPFAPMHPQGFTIGAMYHFGHPR